MTPEDQKLIGRVERAVGTSEQDYRQFIDDVLELCKLAKMRPEIHVATGELLSASSQMISFVESQDAAPDHLNRDQREGWDMAMRLVQSCRPLAKLAEAKTRLDLALHAEAQTLLNK